MSADLIDRLEKATGPSLVLDGEVWCAINGYEFVQWDGAGCVYKKPGTSGYQGISHELHRNIRPVTASLDEAVALAKRVLPGASWNTGAFPNIRAQIAVPVKTNFGSAIGLRGDATGATPAIALLIAILKALSSSDSKR